MVTAIGWHPVRAVDPGFCIIAWVRALVDYCDLTTAWAASFRWPCRIHLQTFLNAAGWERFPVPGQKFQLETILHCSIMHQQRHHLHHHFD